MKTVKEVSKLTGISIFTLCCYNQIDLLKPSALTEVLVYRRIMDESKGKNAGRITVQGVARWIIRGKNEM